MIILESRGTADRNSLKFIAKKRSATRNLFLTKTTATGLRFGIQPSEGKTMKKRKLHKKMHLIYFHHAFWDNDIIKVEYLCKKYTNAGI
jgi:hypothetical protein